MNMHADEKSDEGIVPEKRPNNGSLLPAEAVEGRTSPKGNGGQTAAVRTQSRVAASSGLAAVRQAARQSKGVRFTALLHHLTVELLERSYFALKRNAAPGIDGVTWQAYGENLGENLPELQARIHRGSYRARPARRSYIPKPDGTERPLSVLCLEDKIVQQAVVFVLEAIYEVDFLGFSYGFRPGRGQHDALDALHAGIYRKSVNWVLDADVQGFFDAMSHEWILRFLRHRISDKRILRLIAKWLKVGITEGTQVTRSSRGAPQGAVISPILANVYLHYAFDLWSHVWRRQKASGDVIVIRYADDILLGFQHEHEARAFLQDLQARIARVRIGLAPEDKTRMIRFGRYVRSSNAGSWGRGSRRPSTSSALPTSARDHCKSPGPLLSGARRSRNGCERRLQEIKMELRKRMARSPSRRPGAWLSKVLKGHLNYYAVPLNARSVTWFFSQRSGTCGGVRSGGAANGRS